MNIPKNLVHKVLIYLFLTTKGTTKKANIPKTTVIKSCDVQIIQPKAFPASIGMLYRNKIFAIKIGKKPKPPLVNVMVRLPITNATKHVPSEIPDVASSANVVV